MTIETKYNIGDMVWFMENNMVAHRAISVVYVEGGIVNGKTRLQILYKMNAHKEIGCDALVRESDLFPTKEELLKSL